MNTPDYKKDYPLQDLIPYARNSRTHSDEQVTQIASSIKEFGFTNPVLIDADGGIIAGHGRVMAAKKLKMETVPVIVLSHLTEAQRRAYVIADNKLALNAGWDDEMLRVEFQELQDLGFDVELTGFSMDEINALTVEEVEGLTDEDAVPEAPETPVSVLGDVWLLGNHRLMCGDSTSVDDVDKAKGGREPELMYTDPPYGVKLDQSWRDKALGDKALGKGNSNIIQNDDRFDWTDTYSLFNGDIAYVWCPSKFYHEFHKGLEECELIPTQMIIWNKSVMVMGRSYYHWKHEPCIYAIRKGGSHYWSGDRKQTTVWDAAPPNHIMGGSNEDKTGHPSQKPVSLAERAIGNHACKVIYEPFNGSGSTLIACEKLGKVCIAIDLEPKYIDMAINRWQQFTGKQAIHEESGKTYEELSNEGR
jgi:DNA modification methylase